MQRMTECMIRPSLCAYLASNTTLSRARMIYLHQNGQQHHEQCEISAHTGCQLTELRGGQKYNIDPSHLFADWVTSS
jgi:hypothetical protein